MTKRQAIILAAGSFIHPIKKIILDQLNECQLSVTSITNELRSQGRRLEQSVVSSHLSDLRATGLISYEESGKYHIYRVSAKQQLLKHFQNRYNALTRATLQHPNMSSNAMQGGSLPLYAAALLILDNPKVKKILALFAIQDELSPSHICFQLKDERYNSIISTKLRDMRNANLIHVSKMEGRMIWYRLNKSAIELLSQFESEY
jgi:DNA-binding transcriptional ArsR family regulator